VLASEVLSSTSVLGSVNESENYVLKVTPVAASARAASTRMDGEAELWHRRFNHLSFENLKRVVGMVDGMPSTGAHAKRVPGTVCVPCVDGKMARSPHYRSTTTTSECELVHTDVDGPLTATLGGSVYFVTLMEDSTGFIMATPIKSNGMVPDVLKARNKQLETLTGLKVKRVCHDGAKEDVNRDLQAWNEDKGITREKMAPQSSQQNEKAERANRYIMERVRAALLDAGAEEELWAEAFSSVIHVLNRSPKTVQDVTPLKALTGSRPDVKRFRVWGRREWALRPTQQQRKLEPRTDVGRFAGYSFGGKAYRILADGSKKVFELRDVLMEETSSKDIKMTSAPGPASSLFLTVQTNGYKEEGAIDMLDAEAPSGDEYASQQSSKSDDEPDEDGGLNAEDGDEDDAGEDAAAHDGHEVLPGSTTEIGGDGVQALWRSKRKLAPKKAWWESNPKAYVAVGPFAGAQSSWDLRQPPTNAKEARARSTWPLWKSAEKKEYLVHKKLGTWSKTKSNSN